MKLIITLLLFCTASFAFSQQTNENMDVGGTNRTYVQYLPTGFDPGTESLPVVFCLHGLGDVATNIANIGFNPIGDTARFISVYPQGLTNGFGQTSWSNGTQLLSTNAEDIAFFHQLIDEMVLTHNADPTRIYMTGFSMGGIMCHRLACSLNDRVAAIGTMSGTMSTADMNSCTPSYATPVMHVHGTADGTVPYDGAALPSLELVQPTIDFWRDVHTCAATSDSTQLPDIASDGFTVDRFVYQSCNPLASVELWRVNGGDHQYFYEPLNDFTEAVELWHFLSQWSHSSPAPAGILDNELAQLKVYPNPTSGMITVSAAIQAEAIIYSTTGTALMNVDLNEGENQIDLGNLESGIYFIQIENAPKSAQRIVIQ